MIVTRFAPSPTGRLHVGNIRTALVNWLLARGGGGRFLLRLDDTDAARSTAAFAEAIEADLAWLGLNPDDRVRQSDRADLYEAEFARLIAAGRVYPAYESPEELELKRKLRAARGLPPLYDRAALALTAEERAAKEAEGTPSHWRFRLDHGSPITWDDQVRGEQRFDPALLSDPVVRRADGSWLYLLPSVIDDIDMGITHVVRGEDHVSNTAAQIQMFEALGAAPPVFAHLALLTGSEGALSKRLGSLGVDALRDEGIEAVSLAALLARIGTRRPVEPVDSVEALAKGFDLADFGRAPARFDMAELEALNTRILHALPFDAVAARLPDGMDAAAWKAIRPNLTRLSEAADWWAVVTTDPALPELTAEDRAFLARAADLVAAGASDWAGLTAALKAETGRKGRGLFLPLRLALTGRDHGPDMAALLPLIGQDRALARLKAAAKE
ncbi:glutamate--tRNA ligase [Sphingomonas jatrophae]|nr:glutamate--tRNA ligase [Sphingomonas jatrophae]